MKRYVFLILILVSTLFAETKCENRLFSFDVAENSINLDEFLKELVVGNCKLNIVYGDSVIKNKLINLKLHKTVVKNYTLNQVLDLLVTSNNLFYELKDNKLILSYIKTKTFNLDYITAERSGISSFTATSDNSSNREQNNEPDDNDVNTLNTKDVFNFWNGLSAKLEYIMSKNGSEIDKASVSIDKNSGLVSVTGTKKQLEKVEEYIDKLNKRVHKSVIIDVKIYSVSLDKAKQTGINWSNLSFSIDSNGKPYSIPIRPSSVVGSQSVFSNAVFNVSGLLNFLSTQGKVSSISNPKIATMNNQKAIISVGDNVHYVYNYTAYKNDADGNPVPYPIQKNGTKFVGILLDITPEISDDNTIILRINPKISSFKDKTQLSDPTRRLAPDTIVNKLSTVVRMKDGQTLVLGGLITNKDGTTSTGVPVLKDIPLLKYLFSSKIRTSERSELVFVVTPHVIDLNKKRTLQDLGF